MFACTPCVTLAADCVHRMERELLRCSVSQRTVETYVYKFYYRDE